MHSRQGLRNILLNKMKVYTLLYFSKLKKTESQDNRRPNPTYDFIIQPNHNNPRIKIHIKKYLVYAETISSFVKLSS